MKIAARDLKVGDVVRLNSATAWRILSIEQVTAKMIGYRGEYLHCEFSPGRVGTLMYYSHRLGTQVPIDDRP